MARFHPAARPVRRHREDVLAIHRRGRARRVRAGAASAADAAAGGPPAAVKMSQCPVCGTYVVPGKAISLVSGGSPIYFDSEKCRAEYQSR